MAYVVAADFRERTVKPYCAHLILGEADGTDAYIDLIIAQVTTQVEIDLADDFEPPNPDSDEVISVDGSGWGRLYLPRRVRSLTTVETRALEVYTVQASTTWRLRKSLNAAGTAMVEGRVSDWLDAVSLSTSAWSWGADTVRLTGKFGWAVVPDDIKRLVALKVYDQIKGNADPLSRIVQRQTLDATITYGPSTEVTDIMARYQRTSLIVG
ncbi:MAG: hypothetical protein M3516_05945 [Actinomycetota bacterium]|nr:hypothetical protein [Actinomycetota bacterium]